MLRIAVLGDVHLGHNNTKADHILASLRFMLPFNEVTAKLDLIIIEGDWTDRSLSMTDPYIWEIKRYVNELIRFCAINDIVLRICRGTPSHDWNQPYMFVHENETNNLGCDVRYITDVSVEHHEKLGLDILYVPDEWRPTTEETWSDVEAALRSAGLQQVDIAVVHGTFPHQLPKNAQNPAFVHDPERYSKIVKHWVFVGHIHFMSQIGKIVAAGSFDRISHGEEADKGYIIAEINDACEDTLSFIVNTVAKKYITVKCVGLDEKQVLEKVAKAVRHLPPDSFIRLKADKNDIAVGMLAWFKGNYPQHTWTFSLNSKETKKSVDEIVDNRQPSTRISITKANISDLLIPRVQAKNPVLTERCKARLGDMIDE